MKCICKLIFLYIWIFSVSVFAQTDKMTFWTKAPHGANMFSENPESDFKDISRFGIRLIRFGALGAGESHSDFRFLVKGQPPNEEWDLSPLNLERLKKIVLNAKNHNLYVVIALAHIPGRPSEFRKRDYRIWREDRYKREFIKAWKTIAETLRGIDAVVGYDLINEPYLPKEASSITPLVDLYQKTIDAIRSVDEDTPIVLESANMAAVSNLPDILPLNDKKTIYSFHYYDPFPYFSPPLNRGKLVYPGMIPSVEKEKPILWNKETHIKQFESIRDWQIKHKIEPYRIYVGEFGIWRKAKGANTYLKDLLDIFEGYGWSWTYYAFREDGWDVADLERLDNKPNRVETEIFRSIKTYFR